MAICSGSGVYENLSPAYTACVDLSPMGQNL